MPYLVILLGFAVAQCWSLYFMMNDTPTWAIYAYCISLAPYSLFLMWLSNRFQR